MCKVVAPALSVSVQRGVQREGGEGGSVQSGSACTECECKGVFKGMGGGEGSVQSGDSGGASVQSGGACTERECAKGCAKGRGGECAKWRRLHCECAKGCAKGGGEGGECAKRHRLQ